MKGVSPIREQGYQDPLLVKVMKAHGLEELPLYKGRSPEQNARRQRWRELGRLRDGPVNPELKAVADPARAAAEIKELALRLGAGAVGIARLTPIMIRDGLDLSHDTVICAIVPEAYAEALKGPRATEAEALEVYSRCVELSTALARHIRSLGYPALAHHNGGCDIQAIPAMIACGLGELGKHGSLVHPEFGASHRPGMVTTTMPLAIDQPIVFGVQDTCLSCNLCTNNCPGDAIPADDWVMTEGVRRWVTDVERCYVYSRLREQYCHICVDVCPYVHKANRDSDKKNLYKRYMRSRKLAGYKAPTWWPEEEATALARIAPDRRPPRST